MIDDDDNSLCLVGDEAEELLLRGVEARSAALGPRRVVRGAVEHLHRAEQCRERALDVVSHLRREASEHDETLRSRTRLCHRERELASDSSDEQSDAARSEDLNGQPSRERGEDG